MITLIGVLGATIILILFLLDELHLIDADNFWYDGGNFIGSSLLIFYAYALGSIPFLILNSIWALFSLRDIIFPTKKKKR